MGKSQSPREPDEVVEIDLVSIIFYPLIQSIRRVVTGVAGGMAFYWLQNQSSMWEGFTYFLSIVIILWIGEIVLMPIARDWRP